MCFQNEVDIPILMTGVMVLVILLPVVPVGMEGFLHDVCDIVARITALITKKPGKDFSPWQYEYHQISKQKQFQ